MSSNGLQLGVDLDARVLIAGTLLIRYYKGVRYEVRVTHRYARAISSAARRRGWWRYVFQGRRYQSLSGIAFKITGDRNMSGNRFFGLRRQRRGQRNGA